MMTMMMFTTAACVDTLCTSLFVYFRSEGARPKQRQQQRVIDKGGLT